MKKIYFITTLVLLTQALHAQIDRTKAPKASPAREIKIGAYQSFQLKNGLEVFVVENHKLPRVQYNINLKHESLLEGDKAGYVTIAGDLIGTGTKTRTKAQLDEEVDYIGADLSSSATGITASSLTKHSDKLLELMADVLYNPSFLQEELDKLKTQTLSGISAGKDDPNSISSNVKQALMYGKGHPYGEVITEKTISAITLDDCKNYYSYWFKPNNAYLIIVGDLDLKTAKAQAEKYFSKWVPGEVKQVTYPQPQAPAKTFVALVDRPNSVQSVISVSYPVELKVGTPDAIKTRVTNEVLGDGFSSRLMQNLREKHGYTYGIRSRLASDPIVGNFNAGASVRNEVTDSSVNEIIKELKRIADAPVTEHEFTVAKASISGAFGRSLENPSTIASFALNTAKYKLPKDYYNNYLKYVDAVTIAEVQQTAKRYILPEHALILVVGKGSEVADKLKAFGEVKYYDIEGNGYIPSKSAAIPAGLTGEKVISKYLDAIGGLKKIQELQTYKAEYSADFQGNKLGLKMTKKSPAKMVVEVGMGGMVFQKILSTGKTVSITAQGQKAPVDAKLQEKTIFESAIVPEANLAGVKLALKGIESVDGKDAYAVDFNFAQGGTTTLYYDVATGLRVQEVETTQGPQGAVTGVTKYLDYKEVKGVKFAHTFTQSQGPMNFKFEVVTLEINTPVDDVVFTAE